ncbi:S-adenosylmethionine:diacylglycerol 3-amino-3-carboxypropyl transferase [Sulfurifustis variabilis]|uniref:S-adenosylmethionine:diacylglycerol 3-amino-3-carboxypropyl transferase n=1 Tax=Sulfurifustis variabilis TaxID=1675686 RepID=A0A1B4VD60_9GAMM|nr:BtaA family protein [Sulfurifustis variabilis]BAU50281.1 S-adenosylmethionine:diacylglycerol 3-amino-3-carboxypropyl transferase [Sulfurifustis variabilis]
MTSEVQARADFSRIRYAQCWEDADILVEGLAVEPGDVCLSIASAGDNALALLTRRPARVLAVDLNPAQLACLELRVAAYRELAHGELLELVGSRPSRRRADLYRRCRPLLSSDVARFWDAQSQRIEAGIGSAGKFEDYFAFFRTRILPLVHNRARVSRLLAGGSPEERQRFYREEWDSWRWRALFRVFFSRFVMGRLGRDPSFFRYVEGSVAERILSRTRHALTKLDPAANPYLQWILTGTHPSALPLALRPEHFDTIRAHLDRLEWRLCSVEDALPAVGRGAVSRFNLSDIFEYMSPGSYERLLERLVAAARPGARLAYWNMLAPRRRPERLVSVLAPQEALAEALFARDKAFFYSAFVLEEVRA